MRYFTVLLALSEPGIALTARYDNIRAGSAEEAETVARYAARDHYGGKDWQIERTEETG